MPTARTFFGAGSASPVADGAIGLPEGIAVGSSEAPARRQLTVVGLQPGYLPWLGFFDQVQRSDVFVFYDEGQFDRHGWRNRNRIKAPTGQPHWLTVPVRHDGFQRIMDVEIDNSTCWAQKHIRTLRTWYGRAPYVHRYLAELEEFLTRRWVRIADLDIALAGLMCGWLGIKPNFFRSSELGLPGRRSEMALHYCLHFAGTRFLSGDAAKVYLDVDLLNRHDIEVVWQHYAHPVYPQRHGPFVPYLSAIDLLFNCGDTSAGIIASGSGAPAF